MDNCSSEVYINRFKKPSKEYSIWSLEKLKKLNHLIDKISSKKGKSTVIVFEVGHFILPKDEENLEWAERNILFADNICRYIIKKYDRKFKIIPTLLVNNLGESSEEDLKEIIEVLLKKSRFINHRSLKIVSERNLKNRAFKALKKDSSLSDSFIKIDGKAYLKDDEYRHDLAAGFVSESGEIIPRCGLILTSYLELLSRLSSQRVHQSKDVEMIFISFSQHYHEYKRVMLGIDIYDKIDKKIKIDPIILHWNYNQDRCYLSFKEVSKNRWKDLDL